MKKVTVIIPYKIDRGWLKDAIHSVPSDVQLLISQGEGNWPENFNKVLKQATGDFIRFLHEDDMLYPESIKYSLETFEREKADFIHGNSIELHQESGKQFLWIPPVKYPLLNNLLQKNTIHSSTLMYRREIFEKIGSFDESLNTAEEFEFNLRCLKNGMKIGYCPKVLAYYRRHPAQKVRVVPVFEKDKERELVRNKYKV